MGVRSSARPADLEGYHHEADAIAAYLLRHAEDLDHALAGVGASFQADVAGVRHVVSQLRALSGWVQGVAEAFAAAGGAAPSVGATSVVLAGAEQIEPSVAVDQARPYRRAEDAAVFEEQDVSIEDIVRDHLWEGLKSLLPGGESPTDVALDMLADLAQQLAPELLNQMLSMRAYGRSPDYVVAEADAFSPFFGLGAGAFITYTRSGEIFVAPEGGVGVPGAGVSVRAGWLDQDEMPSDDEVNAFVEGFALTGSLGVGQYAVAATWNPGTDLSDVAYEQGVAAGDDPGSVSVSYSADVGDSGYGWTG